MSERVQDKSLKVSNGGSMRGDLNQEVLDVGTDDIQDMTKRDHQRRIWDKKKNRYTTLENLNREQQKEIRYLRNEAGERVKRSNMQREKDGMLYQKWMDSSNLRVQAVGESKNEKNAKKASAKAYVTLRNRNAGESSKLGASILAGSKSPLLMKLEND
eukprot:163755-Hanusia_phi.AAC.2